MSNDNNNNTASPASIRPQKKEEVGFHNAPRKKIAKKQPASRETTPEQQAAPLEQSQPFEALEPATQPETPTTPSHRNLLPDEKRKLTAFHEAGHAVADHLGGFSPYRVTIKHEGDTLGRVHSLDGYLSSPEVTASQIESMLMSLYAGYAAEIEVGGDASAARKGACDDFNAAREILEGFVDEQDELKWVQLAQKFVRDNWGAITHVAEYLLVHETMDLVEVELLVEDSASPEELTAYRQQRGPLA
jgi:hypothetical protein